MSDELTPTPKEQIAAFLKKTHFKKKLFGGVDEADVWKKIAKLNALYEAALQAERVRYDALLEQKEMPHEQEP